MVLNLDEATQKQILLLAPDLLGQTLARQLTTENPKIDVILKSDSLKRHPSLVIWSIESLDTPNGVKQELKKLKKRWYPCPILLLLPLRIKSDLNEILEFDCTGLLQDPDIDTLNQSISTILNGGRVVKLRDTVKKTSLKSNFLKNYSQKIYTSCTKVIDREFNDLDFLLSQQKANILTILLLKSRKRELSAARSTLNWFWSPLIYKVNNTDIHITSVFQQKENPYSTDIVLSDKNNRTVLEALFTQLSTSLAHKLVNKTNTSFAFEALVSTKQNDLIESLLIQLRNLFNQLESLEENQQSILSTWNLLQKELKKQSVRNLIGNYERLNFKGELVSIQDKLISLIDFEQTDDELPNPLSMLDSLILNKPLKVNGLNLPPDDPRALIKLQLLLSNWLIRNTETLSSELINVCSLWPELRHYLLDECLIPTRELERLRNHLNSQNRFNSIIKKPIQMYESKRVLYEINNGEVISHNITEARDDELSQLDWIQRQVALLVEARDALAPQLQYIVKYVGNLMVIILTNVVGRALGLIGKGIAQGMGRTITNK